MARNKWLAGSQKGFFLWTSLKILDNITTAHLLAPKSKSGDDLQFRYPGTNSTKQFTKHPRILLPKHMQIIRQACKMEQLNTNLLDSRCYKRELQTRIGLEIRFCNFDAIHDLHFYGFNEFKSIEWVREKNFTPTFPFT